MSQPGTLSRSSMPSAGDAGPRPRQVVLGGVAVLAVVAVDLALVGELSFFFDLCFVVLCVGLAAVVRPDDWFSVGVVPPLTMVALFVVLGLAAPATLAHPDDGVVQAVVTGLAHHSGALVAGYLACLVTLALRRSGLSR